jgi:hypothetical protein
VVIGYSVFKEETISILKNALGYWLYICKTLAMIEYLINITTRSLLQGCGLQFMSACYVGRQVKGAQGQLLHSQTNCLYRSLSVNYNMYVHT